LFCFFAEVSGQLSAEDVGAFVDEGGEVRAFTGADNGGGVLS
jgi:hypothetical protein